MTFSMKFCIILIVLCLLLLSKRAASTVLSVNGHALPSEYTGTGVVFEDEKALFVSGGPSGKGLLYGSGNSTLIVLRAPNITVVNATLSTGHSALVGGCVVVERAAFLVFERVSFFGCSAVSGGGALSIAAADGLFLRIHRCSFDSISTSMKSEAEGDSALYQAVGSAVRCIIAGQNNGSSQIVVDEVQVSRFSQRLESSGQPAAIGGAFFFAWQDADSGNGVRVSFSNVSFVDGFTSISWSKYCEGYNFCPISSALVQFLWQKNSSGNSVDIDMRDIVVQNVTFGETAFTDAFFFGLAWLEGNSGKDSHFQLQDVSFDEVLIGDYTIVVGGLFLGETSGNGALLNLEGYWAILNSFVGIGSALSSYEWMSNVSGDGSVVSLVNGGLTCANVSFSDDSAVLSFVWMEESSGSDVSVLLLDFNISLSESAFGFGFSFASLEWTSAFSGSHPQFTVRHSAIRLLSISSWPSNSAVVTLQWGGSNSGNGASIILADAIVAVDFSHMGAMSFVFSTVWLGINSGNDFRFLCSAASLSMTDSTLSNGAAFLLGNWQSDNSGDHSLILLNEQSVVESTRSVFQLGSAVFLLSWQGVLSGNGATFRCDDSSLQAASTTLLSTFLVFTWEEEDSGNNFTASFQSRSSIQLNSTIMVTSSAFLLALWQSTSSGNRSQLSFNSAKIFVANMTMESNANLFWLDWQCPDCGYEAVVTVGNESHLTMTESSIGPLSGIVTVLWGYSQSGSAATFTLCDSFVWLESVTFGINSSFVQLQWEEEASGSNTLLKIVNSSLSIGASSFGVEADLISLLWQEEGSGHDAVFSVESTRFQIADSIFLQSASLLSTSWVGERSGMSSTVQLLSSSIICNNVVFSTLSGLLQVLWAAAASGLSGRISLVDTLVLVNGSRLGFNSRLLEVNANAELSGTATVVSLLRSVCKVSATSMGTEAAVVNILWSGPFSANESAFAVQNSSFSVENVQLTSNSHVVAVQFAGSSSGTNSSFSIEASEIDFTRCIFGPYSAGIFVGFMKTDSGSSSSFYLDNLSSISLHSLHMTFFATVVSIYWGQQGGDEANIQLLSPIFAQAVRSTKNSTFLQVFSPGNFSTITFLPTSGASFSETSLESLLVVYNPSASVGTSVTLGKIELFFSSFENMFSAVVSSVSDLSVALTEIFCQNSSAAVMNAVILLSEDSAQESKRQLTAVWIDGVEIVNSSVNLMDMYAEGSRPSHFECTIQNVFSIDSALQGVSCTSFHSKFFLEIALLSVLVSTSEVQLISISVGEGSISLDNITIADSLVSSSLVDVSKLGTSPNNLSVVFAGNTTYTGLDLADDAVLFEMSGGSLLAFEGNCHVQVALSLSSLPLLSAQYAGGIPLVLMRTKGALSYEVVQSDVQGDIVLFDIPNAPTAHSISTFLVASTDYDQFSGTVSETEFALHKVLCPVGYAFSYEVNLYLDFYLPYALPPYNCLQPFFMNHSSCQALNSAGQARCIPCPSGLVSFFQGVSSNSEVTVHSNTSLKQSSIGSLSCQACPTFARCRGPSDLAIFSGFWMPPIPSNWERVVWNNFSLSDTVISCPTGSCNTAEPLAFKNGQKVPGTSLCSSGRDSSSVLCSRCSSNFSASLFSAKCIQGCEMGPLQAATSAVVLLVCVGYTVYILYRSPTPSSPWLRIWTLFLSVSSILLSRGGEMKKETTLTGVLSMVTFSSNSSLLEEYCLPGAQPIAVAALELGLPFTVIAAFLFGLFAKRSFSALKRKIKRRQSRTPLKTNIDIESLRCLVAGLFSLLMIFYSIIASIVFAFVPCKRVPFFLNHSLVFEDRLSVYAELACWSSSTGATFSIIGGIIAVIGAPIGLLLWQTTLPGPSHRLLRRCRAKHSEKSFAVQIIIEGNLRVYYWDALLLFFRGVFCIVSSIVPDGWIREILLLFLILSLAMLHSSLLPYKDRKANICALLSLASLIAVASLNFGYLFLQDVLVLTEQWEDLLNRLAFIQNVLALCGCLVLITGTLLHYGPTVYKHLTRLRRLKSLPCHQKKRKSTATELSDSLLQAHNYLSASRQL